MFHFTTCVVRFLAAGMECEDALVEVRPMMRMFEFYTARTYCSLQGLYAVETGSDFPLMRLREGSSDFLNFRVCRFGVF